MAYLCTEMTDYQCLDKLDAPKKWFQTHIDFIMETYESQYHLQKEEIFLGQHHHYIYHSREIKSTEFHSNRHP